MSEYTIIRGGDEKTFTDREKFEQTVDFLESEGVEFETETPDETVTDGGKATVTVSEESNDAPTLQEDPIGYLQNVNDELVNVIQGTPAISKRGFRYIQAELDITTESKVVAWTDDPYGVVVWARAELPDGRAAEAHGEGSPEESGMDPTEFVRYADTRAKSRALSDLTSAGALAVSELQNDL